MVCCMAYRLKGIVNVMLSIDHREKLDNLHKLVVEQFMLFFTFYSNITCNGIVCLPLEGL